MSKKPAEVLSSATHLTEEEALVLLKNRELTGDPNKHDHPAILITKNEVIVETNSTFNSKRKNIPSDIELAFSTGAKVKQIRKDKKSFNFPKD